MNALVVAFAVMLTLASLLVTQPVGGAPPLDSDTVGAEAIALLADYLKIDTTNPPGNEIAAARFLKAIFDREGIEARVIESEPGRANVYARLKGTGARKAVILLNHMDVVPADKKFWSVDPFGGVVKDGYLWGRGALDMKGHGILQLVTMLAFKRQGLPLEGDVIFLAVADEEAGGQLGAEFMLREHFDLLKDASVVLNEGGNLEVLGGRTWHFVGVSEKSPLRLAIIASGPPGHGSIPRRDSAVKKLVGALERIMNHETPLKVLPEVQEFYTAIAELAPPEHRHRLRDLTTALGDKAFADGFTRRARDNARVRNTIAVTMLEGSSKVNVIPNEARAEIDVRLLPGEDPKAFVEEIRRVIADDTIRVEPTFRVMTGGSPTTHEFFRDLRRLAASEDPRAVVTPILMTGASDCRYFRVRGIPCYGYAPFTLSAGEYDRVHGNDERVSVDNVRQGTRMFYELVRGLVAP
jgi:acetylornithine deacetylase/succinyl-diaminopimelate desuccinylase-like protein